MYVVWGIRVIFSYNCICFSVTPSLIFFQFVPFRDFLRRYGGHNQGVTQSALAKEVLAEIPDQVVSYMKMNGILPRQTRPNEPPPAYSS